MCFYFLTPTCIYIFCPLAFYENIENKDLAVYVMKENFQKKIDGPWWFSINMLFVTVWTVVYIFRLLLFFV